MKPYTNSSYTLPPDFSISKMRIKQTRPDYFGEEKLLNYLFYKYNPNLIPVESINDSLKLYMGLAMSQLINIVILFCYY